MRTQSEMQKCWEITYEDVIHADSMEEAMDILLLQLSRDVRNSDLEAFNIEEQGR